MEKSLSFALKSLVEQVGSAKPAGGDEHARSNSDRVRIADIRNAAEDAKDNLRHSLRS